MVGDESVVPKQRLREHPQYVHVLAAKGQPELIELIDQGIRNIPVDALVALERKWLPALEPFFRSISAVPNLTLEEQLWLQRNHSFRLGVDNSSLRNSLRLVASARLRERVQVGGRMREVACHGQT